MEDINKHKSYGMIDISRFVGGNSQFFGSDLVHNGGIRITIMNAEKERIFNGNYFHGVGELIEINLSNNQFIDAITSGMNTSGVPCTIKRFNGERIPQINHVEDKREQFSNDMINTQEKFSERIDEILKILDGNIGKKKVEELRHELNVLKNHIKFNTNFVMKCFNESMEKSVLEAKHSISNYIDHKVHSLGIENLRNDLQISLGDEKDKLTINRNVKQGDKP